MLICSALLSSCGKPAAIVRREEPAVSIQVDLDEDGRAVIRTLNGEASIQNIETSDWKPLLDNDIFRNRHASSAYRVPHLLFYAITVKNSGDYPMILKNAELIYGNISNPSLTPDNISKRFSSPFYKIFNFAGILSPLRIVADEESFKNINFDADTVKYKLDFIPAGDTLLQIVSFDYPPASVRSYKIGITISVRGYARTLMFMINRREYRTEGDDFIEKRYTDEDLIQ